MPRGVLAVALFVLAAGCGSDGAGSEPSPTASPPAARACTEIGCGPEGAEVSLNRVPRGADVTLCVARRCVTEEDIGPGAQDIGEFLPRAGDSVRVSVTVRQRGRVIRRAVERLQVRTDRPNGPDCPPVCGFIHARFDLPSGVLEAV
jgi:hypothetical protein